MTEKELIKKIQGLSEFRGSGFLITPWNMIKKIGLDACILSNYVDKQIYFATHHPEYGGWFFLKHAEIMQLFQITEKRLRKLKHEWISLGLMKTRMFGHPIKEWIIIDEDKMKEYFTHQLEPYEDLPDGIINPDLPPSRSISSLLETEEQQTLLKGQTQTKNNEGNPAKKNRATLAKKAGYTNNSINNKSISNFNKLKLESKFENFEPKHIPTKKESPAKLNNPAKQIKKESTLDLYAMRLLSYWCSLPYTTTHKISKPLNKSCLQIISDLKSLMNGTFGKKKFFDKKWIEKENIPAAWFSRHWTYAELKDGLEKASRYSLDGYWPTEDKTLFRSLSNILYQCANNHGGKSWLFIAIARPPKPIIEASWKNPFPETTARVIKMDIWPPGYKPDERKISAGIVQLKNFANNLIMDNRGGDRIREFYGSMPLLLNEYVQWLKSQSWIQQVDQKMIGTENGVFRRFIEDQEKELGIEIKIKAGEKCRRQNTNRAHARYA